MLKIFGDVKPVVKRLDEFKRRVETGLVHVVRDQAEDIKGHIKEGYLSGPRGSNKLGVRTGRLRSSITALVKENSDRISVAFGTDVPYARIHEQGGTIPPRLITPKKAGGVLSFMMGNRRVFVKSVNHPGGKIRQRPFLRPGVKDMLPGFRAGIAAFLQKAANVNA